MPKKAVKKSTTTTHELSLVTQPADFFKQKVTTALQSQRLKTNPNTEFYLVDLLSRFMLAENLFKVEADGGKTQEVLALLMGEAMTSEDSSAKIKGLRRLGDVSLYTVGFFSESLARKVVDVDYYIGMGRTAYGNLAQMGHLHDRNFKTVYSELSERFHKFVDVLAEISEQFSTKNDKNLLRLYEVWLKTGSERAEKSLKEAGIIPVKSIKPDWQ